MDETGKKGNAFCAWVTMLLFWTGNALALILVFGFGLILCDVMQDLGLSTLQAGSLAAIGYLGAVILTIPITNLFAKINPKTALGILFLILAGDYVLNALSTSFIMLALSRALGITAGMVLAGVIPIIQNQWFRPQQMGFVNGCQNAFTSLGQILSLAVIPAILGMCGGWRGTYCLTAAAIVIIAALWFLFARENRNEEYEHRLLLHKQERSPILAAFRQKTFVLIALAYACSMCTYIVMLNFWPSFAQESYGMSPALSGAIMGSSGIGALVGALAAGILSDKLGRRRIVSAISAICAVSAYAMLMIVSSPAILAALWFLVGAFVYASATPLYAMPFECNVSPQLMGLGVSMLMVGSQLGMSFGSQIAGYTISMFGLLTGISVLLVAPLAHALLLHFVPEGTEDHEG